MDLTEIAYDGSRPIDGYGPGFFRVGGVVLRGSCLVTPWGASQWAGLADIEPLVALAGRIDVLFIGTGADIAHVPEAFRAKVEAVGIGVEVMNSPAAARTYNVLLGEGRRIAAVLMPV